MSAPPEKEISVVCNRPEATCLPPPAPSRFKSYGRTRADDLERKIVVMFYGRGQVLHYDEQADKETKQPARPFRREEDGMSIVFLHFRADTPGMEQIGADLRDAFFAMGHDEVHFSSTSGPDQYVIYRRE